MIIAAPTTKGFSTLDPLMVALRILHIVFGIFMVGTALFYELVLLPNLKRLGQDVEFQFLRA